MHRIYLPFVWDFCHNFFTSLYLLEQKDRLCAIRFPRDLKFKILWIFVFLTRPDKRHKSIWSVNLCSRKEEEMDLQSKWSIVANWVKIATLCVQKYLTEDITWTRYILFIWWIPEHIVACFALVNNTRFIQHIPLYLIERYIIRYKYFCFIPWDSNLESCLLAFKIGAFTI